MPYPIEFLDTYGREIMDPNPVITPLNLPRPIPLNIRIRNQILAQQAFLKADEEYETEEEAGDFDMSDEGVEFNSPYEVDFDHVSDMQTSVSKDETVVSSGGADARPQADTASEDTKA